MVRVDVYYIPGDGYYWVPIYVADTVKPILPNRAVVAHKRCSEWKEMSEENFLLSLCKNDLVCIESNRPIKLKAANKDSTLEKELTVQRVLAYFEGGNIATTITLILPDLWASRPCKRLKNIRSMFWAIIPV